MKKIGKKFKAKEKLKILEAWWKKGGGRRNANRVARWYECSPQSIYLWANRFDGSVESLENGDQTPHTFPNAYTEEQLNVVKELHGECRSRMEFIIAYAPSGLLMALSVSCIACCAN
ncbi:MAG: helix-turn-helix domain-containing protein [Firmicutes bacterium]|nr:helix-turn-helix domain-containing protein [Bacillota bacterium]